MHKPLPRRRHAPQLLAMSTLACGLLPAQAQQAPCGEVGGSSRFAAFHDNYALWQQMRNNGWASRDESAVRGQLSLKYSFVGCPQRREKDSNALEPAPLDAEAAADKAAGKPTSFAQRMRNAELFLSYTNRFDFYLGSRDSGPVINRVSNPGLHLRVPSDPSDRNKHRDAWQISLEHMSDGQVVEPVTNARDQLSAQRAYERGDHRFFDTISRGMNYVAVQGEWVWDLQKPDAKFDVRAKAKAYIGDSDSAITWGPLAGSGLRFSDYERFKVRLGLYWPFVGRFELTTQIGDRGFKRASHTLGYQYTLQVPAWNLDLPIYAQAHFGPMNTLSNYTQRQDSFGIGVRLAY